MAFQVAHNRGCVYLGLASPWGNIFGKPGKNFFVPIFGVLWFIDPVTFVGKINHSRSNSLSLQRSKQFMALSDWTTEIEIVVNHEHRGLELAEVARFGVG